MVQAPCGSHKTEHIERHKGEQKSAKPAPKGISVQLFIQEKSGEFGKPIGKASEKAKEHPADHHAMEVGDQEQAIMHLRSRQAARRAEFLSSLRR